YTYIYVMCKSFRSAPTFAHRSADYIRSCVKAFSLSQKPSTHLRIGKIPSGKQAFRGNFANPRFVTCKAKNDTTMKNIILTTIVLFSLSTVFGQNGMKSGNLFLLLKDRKTLSINSFENDKINELKSFSISEKSIYTTDQKERVAILDTAKNSVTILNLKTSKEV